MTSRGPTIDFLADFIVKSNRTDALRKFLSHTSISYGCPRKKKFQMLRAACFQWWSTSSKADEWTPDTTKKAAVYAVLTGFFAAVITSSRQQEVSKVTAEFKKDCEVTRSSCNGTLVSVCESRH